MYIKISINNREDANKYYQQVNELIDDYMDKWKVRPSNLKRYLPRGSERFNKFLHRNNLKEVNGIDQVLSDVINDRVNMVKDGVLTFENFKFFESDEFKVSNLKQCLYKGIEKADLNMEKVVADVFDTNLGSIDVVDSGKHIFKVNDWNGKDINVLIYSKEDLELIKSNLVDCLYDELTSKKVLLGGLIDVSLVDFVSQDGFTTMMNDQLSGDGLNDIISQLLEMEVYESFNGYQIWIEKKSTLEDYQ
mgnify:CR=1 FL=1|jgi:hypothetical protein